MDPIPEGTYMNTVIKPVYRFMGDQGYKVQDGKFVRKEKDHDEIIGYDDVTKLFWYPEGLYSMTMYVVSLSPILTFNSSQPSAELFG